MTTSGLAAKTIPDREEEKAKGYRKEQRREKV